MVSSEAQANGFHSGLAGADEPGGRPDLPPDPVLITAGDRFGETTCPAVADPTADHLAGEVAQRRADVDEKHRRLIEFMDGRGLDGVVLGRADSISWFTAGGDLGQNFASESAAVFLFVTRTTRAILADNVQSARVFEEELAGLGFQLKERPWHQEPSRVIAELTHNKAVASDVPWPDLIHEPRQLLSLRRVMTRRERQILRRLGRALTLAIEATCRNFQPGETEADVAGHLAHRLIREGVMPVDLRVAGDDRLARYRQPTFKAIEIRHRATITATGRRQGLCASATRIVSFGPAGADFRADHAIAAMVDATCIYFSRPGEPVSEVFRRARRIYEKLDRHHEWGLDYQGKLIGYAPHEGLLIPDSTDPLLANSALCWGPSVGPARSEDTIVIDRRGFEVVTEAQDWPKVDVSVKGYSIPRPGILER